MKRVIIKSFEDLVSVFPSMTLSNIIAVYLQVQEAIDNITARLNMCTDSDLYDDLEESLVDNMKADAFLSTYLARLFCKQNGF